MPGVIWPDEPGGLSPVAVPVVVLAVGLGMDGVPVPALLSCGVTTPGVVTPGVVTPGLVVVPVGGLRIGCTGGNEGHHCGGSQRDFILVLQSVRPATLSHRWLASPLVLGTSPSTAARH